MQTTAKASVSHVVNRNGTVIFRSETDTEVTFSAWRDGVNDSWGTTKFSKYSLMGRIGTQNVDPRFPMFPVASHAAQHVAAYKAILDSRYAAEITGAPSFKAIDGKIVLESE